MYNLVDEAFKVMVDNLVAHHDGVLLEPAKQAEKRINEKRDQLRKSYLKEITESKDFNMQGGMVYNNMFSSLEKVGDHIINVTEAVVGKI